MHLRQTQISSTNPQRQETTAAPTTPFLPRSTRTTFATVYHGSRTFKRPHPAGVFTEEKQSRACACRCLSTPHNATVINNSLMALAYCVEVEEYSGMLLDARSREIGYSDFSFIFAQITEHACFQLFRWPIMNTRTERNRFAVDPLLAMCVVLRHLSSCAK